MSYVGIGTSDPNHPLEVEGQVFISNVEQGSTTNLVPFEIYSDYTGNSTLTDSRQLRLRVTPSSTTDTYHTDMGLDNVDGNVFFISNPVTGATSGSRLFEIGSDQHVRINTNEVNIGNSAGATSQGSYGVAIGFGAGSTSQRDYGVAVGYQAGSTDQRDYSVAVGYQAGSYAQGTNAVAIGHDAGVEIQATSSVAIGELAGYTSQGWGDAAFGSPAVAIGKRAGSNEQGSSSVAIGYYAGATSQGRAAVAIGVQAGSNVQGGESVAIGYQAGSNVQGISSVAIGRNAGQDDQGNSSVAIGYRAGYTSQGNDCVAFGNRAGYTSQGNDCVAIGYQAGSNVQAISSVAIGNNAGYDQQGNYGVAIGFNAGATSQGVVAVAVGSSAGYWSQSDRSVAVGNNAGMWFQASNSVAIGYGAGSATQGHSSVAIGYLAGYASQGNYCVAIGPVAAAGALQHNNTIILNASGGASLDSTGANRTFIKTIRSAANSEYLKYNSTTGEVTRSTSSDRRMKRNIQLANYSAVEEISKLKVYTFEEKDNGIHPANAETVWTPNVGILSQELYKYAPTMRHTIHIPEDVGDIDSFVPPEDPNDPTVDWSVWGTETAGIDHMRLVPHTMKAIQELNQEIINLKAKISEIENASAPGQ